MLAILLCAATWRRVLAAVLEATEPLGIVNDVATLAGLETTCQKKGSADSFSVSVTRAPRSTA